MVGGMDGQGESWGLWGADAVLGRGRVGGCGGRTQFWAGASLCKRDNIPVN